MAARTLRGELEVAAAVLAPHFDAVRDVFVAFSPDGSATLDKLSKTEMLVDPSIHDTERHLAACRDDGRQILLAPEAAGLPVGTLTAILSHEFGHASDFAYPRHWRFVGRDKPAEWQVPSGNRVVRRMRDWEDRGTDQVEWTADAIAYAVTGKKVGYCGPCMLQCFSGGVSRPRGLR